MNIAINEESKQFRDRWDLLNANPNIISVSGRLSTTSLAKIGLLSRFDTTTLEKIAPDVAVVKWKSDAEIFTEGSYTDTAFLILGGYVNLTSRVLSQAMFTLSADKRKLAVGDIFGEIGAVSGWPQTFTATTAIECALLHLRAPALRQLRKKNAGMNLLLESEYRKHGMLAAIKSVPVFSSIPELALSQYANEFELISFEPGETVFSRFSKAYSLYIVRAGFVKLSEPYGDTEITLNYLGSGKTLGEIEFFSYDQLYLANASAVEYLDLIKIPFSTLRKLAPYDFKLTSALRELAKETARSYKTHKDDLKHSALMEASMSTGAIEGTSILVIDLDQCTRCDDCVRGCAETHGGIPRFVREGNRYENHLVTRACFQCRDPLCLVGCPTGAIHRAGIGEVVKITDDLCIGCKVCANNCPYDAIVMHDTGEIWGHDALPQGLRGKERLLATKCDLCAGLNHGYACVESCPIGCAVRVENLEQL